MTLSQRTRAAVDKAPVLDLHTHLFAPQFGSLNLWGIDELLTYHYLVAETLRAQPAITPGDFYRRPKTSQADLVWETLFVKNTPVSEATSGITTVMTALGLNPTATNLSEARNYFEKRDPSIHVDEMLRLAGVSSLVMTNDPLDPQERDIWMRGIDRDPRFHSALRIDPILNHWLATVPRLKSFGYDADNMLSLNAIFDLRRFLGEWIERMQPMYVAVSLEDTFTYPDSSTRSTLLDRIVMPTCREYNLPFAMMIGVRRAINPRLLGAGDGMGVADLSSIERLAARYPEVRFLVTTLAKENAHGLCVVARKFANVLPFGCWWFMNNPSLVEETTLMRLEMLGATFVPQHSDARILEQLIYKWRHARRAVANALTTRYEALEESGRPPSDEEIERDARALMGGIAAEWVGVTV